MWGILDSGVLHNVRLQKGLMLYYDPLQSSTYMIYHLWLYLNPRKYFQQRGLTAPKTLLKNIINMEL